MKQECGERAWYDKPKAMGKHWHVCGWPRNAHPSDGHGCRVCGLLFGHVTGEAIRAGLAAAAPHIARPRSTP